LRQAELGHLERDSPEGQAQLGAVLRIKELVRARRALLQRLIGLRNITATGARLRVEGSVSAPDTFELIVELDGLEADCEVVWRKAAEVGVRFLSKPRRVTARRTQVVNPLVPSPTPSLRRKPKSP
jgi:hypothetical protein